MKLISVFVIVTVISLKYRNCLGSPLTKWFKTDNNTYYIEPEEKFTWQQSYGECQRRNLRLITLKAFKEDALLLEYLTRTFNPKPEFWLKANDNIDLNNITKLLDSMFTADFFNIKMDGVNDDQIIQSNNPDNCALTLAGTVKACESLHGFICHDNNTTSNGGQNIQNIVLKFN